MLQKIPGNQKIKQKTWAYWVKVKVPNLTFSALCGLAISYLFKSYFLLLPFYIPVLYTCLYAWTKENCSPFLIFSFLQLCSQWWAILPFLSSLLKNHRSKFYHPKWHLGQEGSLDFTGTAFSLLWLPQLCLSCYNERQSSLVIVSLLNSQCVSSQCSSHIWWGTHT